MRPPRRLGEGSAGVLSPEQLRGLDQSPTGGWGRYRSRSAAEAGVGGARADLWRLLPGERLGETDDDPVRSADEAEPVLILVLTMSRTSSAPWS